MKYSFFFLFLFTLLSCKDEDPDFRTQNEADIKAYIDENNLDATRTNSGLYIIVDEQGTGAQPTATDNVTVVYKGYFLNGAVFDPGKESGTTFSLKSVILGWTEGIPYFKEGGKGKLLVPAHLGYGSDGYPPFIPGGAVLIFDVELISVN